MTAREMLKEIKHDGRYIDRRMLKPCPFCGGEAIIKTGYNSRPEEGYEYYEVECKECFASVCGKSRNTYREDIGKAIFSAVDKWNNRTGEEK